MPDSFISKRPGQQVTCVGARQNSHVTSTYVHSTVHNSLFTVIGGGTWDVGSKLKFLFNFISNIWVSNVGCWVPGGDWRAATTTATGGRGGVVSFSRLRTSLPVAMTTPPLSVCDYATPIKRFEGNFRDWRVTFNNCVWMLASIFVILLDSWFCKFQLGYICKVRFFLF